MEVASDIIVNNIMKRVTNKGQEVSTERHFKQEKKFKSCVYLSTGHFV